MNARRTWWDALRDWWQGAVDEDVYGPDEEDDVEDDPEFGPPEPWPGDDRG